MFFSTQKNSGIYRILNHSILLHFKKKFNYGGETNHAKIIKNFNFSFFLFFIFHSMKLLIFRNKENFLFIKYKKSNIGKHVTSRVFRDVTSYKSEFNLLKNYLKYFYIAGLTIESANYYAKHSKAIFIDHVGYINGLFFSIFAEKKKIIYTNSYPRGLFFIDFSKNNNFKKKELETCIKLEKKKIKLKKKEYIKRLIYKPELIPHIRKQKWHDSKIKNLKKIDYVIYTHSFVDGLLWWGNDGFVNLRDWTEFTIQTLIKKNANILVKIHPNFFQKIDHDFIKLDKKIFYEIMNKYSYYKNISFIDFPVRNKFILDSLRKDAIIVSHHGTALLEGAARKFKCISSIATLWNKNIKITNSWKNKKDYENLLNKKWINLKYADKKSFNNLELQLFSNKYSLWGKKYWQQNLADIVGVHLHTLIANPHKICDTINQDKYLRSVNKISHCIEEVNL